MRILLLLISNFSVVFLLNLIIIYFELDKEIGNDYFYLLIFCSIFGFAGSFISLLTSKSVAKRYYNIETISYDQSDEWDWYRQYAKEISLKSGINPPEIGIYYSEDINAFATGATKNNSLVALSTGLIENMNLDEVKGVIGHEIAHIQNGDMVTMTLLQGVLNTFVLFFSRIISSVVSRNERFSFLIQIAITIVLEVIFGLIALIIINSFSRWREYRADLWCAKNVGKKYMLSALEKLKNDEPTVEDGSLAAFRISNNGLFSTHPKIEKRIQRIKNLPR